MPQTVAAMDVLVPRIGEIIGGSQREDDYGILLARMNEMGVGVDPVRSSPRATSMANVLRMPDPRKHAPQKSGRVNDRLSNAFANHVDHPCSTPAVIYTGAASLVPRPQALRQPAARRLRARLRASHHVRHWYREHP